MPQKYLFSDSLQIKASQGVLRGQSSIKLTGQGSAAQHTPQPLHGSPSAGFAGASAWIVMVWGFVVTIKD